MKQIYDWMHRWIKHDMNYYSKVPQGKGGTATVEMPKMASEDKSTDRFFGLRRDALLWVELTGEAPAAAEAIYQVLGMDGILTIGTLGSTPHHQFRRLGKEPTILEEEEEEDDDIVEDMAITAQPFSVSKIAKTKKNLVRPREKLALQSTMPGVPMQLEMAAHYGGGEEEKFLEKPLLAKAEEEGVELEKERLTLMDLFVMSDEELEDNDLYFGRNGKNTSTAMSRNDGSGAVTKGGTSVVWKKIRNFGGAGAVAPAAADKIKESQFAAKLPGVEPSKKKDKEGASRKFRKLIRSMTRKKIHPDVDILKAEAETGLRANKNIHREGIRDNPSNMTTIKCTPFFY